jgi:hypothetical protein
VNANCNCNFRSSELSFQIARYEKRVTHVIHLAAKVGGLFSNLKYKVRSVTLNFKWNFKSFPHHILKERANAMSCISLGGRQLQSKQDLSVSIQ